MKKLIITAIALTVIIVGVVLMITLKPISFTFGEGVAAITIYTPKDRTVAHLTESEARQWLPKGDYYAIPEGAQVNVDKIAFAVTHAASITIDPGYSDEYLAKQTPAATDAISKILQDTYPAASQYLIASEKLFHYGEWYGATLFNTASNPDAKKDFYRFIARYDGTTWKLVGTPQLVLSKKLLPGTPSRIVDAVNALSPDESLLYENY